MSVVLDIRTAIVTEDPRWPDGDESFVYDHLRYVHSRTSPFPLPAIDIALVGEKLVVTGGHKYLRIARELGVERIRGIVWSRRDDAAPRDFPAGVRVIGREVLDAEERGLPNCPAWCVFFFDGPLDSEGQRRFVEEIAGFWDRNEAGADSQPVRRMIRCGFPFDAVCGEFEVLLPPIVQTHAAIFLEACRRFSQQVRRIVTFQGRRFVEVGECKG